MEEHRVIETVQGRQELAQIIGAARGHLQQIDAGGKDAARPCEYHGARVRGAKFLETLGQAFSAMSSAFALPCFMVTMAIASSVFTSIIDSGGVFPSKVPPTISQPRHG